VTLREEGQEKLNATKKENEKEPNIEEKAGDAAGQGENEILPKDEEQERKESGHEKEGEETAGEGDDKPIVSSRLSHSSPVLRNSGTLPINQSEAAKEAVEGVKLEKGNAGISLSVEDFSTRVSDKPTIGRDRGSSFDLKRKAIREEIFQSNSIAFTGVAGPTTANQGSSSLQNTPTTKRKNDLEETKQEKRKSDGDAEGGEGKVKEGSEGGETEDDKAVPIELPEQLIKNIKIRSCFLLFFLRLFHNYSRFVAVLRRFPDPIFIFNKAKFLKKHPQAEVLSLSLSLSFSLSFSLSLFLSFSFSFSLSLFLSLSLSLSLFLFLSLSLSLSLSLFLFLSL